MVKYSAITLFLLQQYNVTNAWTPSSPLLPLLVTPTSRLLKTVDKIDTKSITSIQTSIPSASSSSTQSTSTIVPEIQQLNLDKIDLFSQVESTLNNLRGEILKISNENHVVIPNDILSKIDSLTSAIDEKLLSNPTLGPIISNLQSQLTTIFGSFGLDNNNAVLSHPSITIFLSTVVTFITVNSILAATRGESSSSSPYPTGKYDPQAAKEYFDGRFDQVITRSLQIFGTSAKFGLALLNDKLSDKLSENAEKRAQELSQLLTELGPTFIKVGQSLSIRTDLLSPAYVRGLKTLQDKVPSFPTSIAREMIEEELGQSIQTIFSEFSPEPVAAASLGQVYRAKLKSNGMEVAVKVQRPNIMNQIALDMHILREAAPVLKSLFNLNTDTVGTVDAWGSGFVDELDYISEAQNAEYFDESIKTTPLSGVVFSPPVVEEYTSGKVLTTEWVVGERLDQSSSDDVTILCSIAMNTYLTMMLETGVLHCDPHPGNLLRTPDGRLCILDWGMVTRLNSDLQVTLIEHMAHLTSADYAEIPRDLLLLGFIPESKADLIEDSGIVEVLADIYGAWKGGGGAAAINVNKVVAQLQDLTAEKGNLFQIPPYFAYIAKSFSVLEGIGLSNNPKYSIIDECLPYVSKRLLTDKSERTGGALSTFIFGPTKNDIKNRIIDYDRVEQLISGFGDYTTSASGAQIGANKSRTQLLDEYSNQILDLLATEEETPLQTIFIEQLAKVISSNSRSIWSDLRQRSGQLPNGRTTLGFLVDPLGLFRTSPIVRMNDLDERTVETTRNLISLLVEQNQSESSMAMNVSNLSSSEIQELSSTLVRKIWNRRGGLIKVANRLANKLLTLTAEKLESGERDIYILPLPQSEDKTLVSEVENSRGTLNIKAESSRSGGTMNIKAENARSGRTMNIRTESSRLEGARKILEELEKNEAATR